MLSKTEPRHVLPLAARRAQAEGPRTVLHPRMFCRAGLAARAARPETPGLPRKLRRHHLLPHQNRGGCGRKREAAEGAEGPAQRRLPCRGASCPCGAGRGGGVRARNLDLGCLPGLVPGPTSPSAPKGLFQGLERQGCPKDRAGWL